MVQVLADPAVSVHGGFAADGTVAPEVLAREEHARRMRDLQQRRGVGKTPRRGFSLTDYQGDFTEFTPSVPSQPASGAVNVDASIPENTVLRTGTPVSQQQLQPPRPLPLRKKTPPRRSQSVTDKEPETVSPDQPQVSEYSNIVDLPSELHYTLFDWLDPIDAACLGVTNTRLYAILKRKYPKVPLSSRYSGPNDREWAWRGAKHVVPSLAKQDSTKSENGLERLRVKGQVYCRKCGTSRCELHRHLKEWMGEGYEYCEIKERFGKPADENARQTCNMASPKDRYRCGRHGPLKK